MTDITVTKSSDINYLFLACKNKIKYTIIITNSGTTDAVSVVLNDLLGNGLTIDKKSILVDGCFKCPLANGTIEIGTIKAGGNSIVVYEVDVPEDYKGDSIINKAVVNYCDSESPLQCNREVAESKTLVIPVIKMKVKMRKLVDKTLVKLNEELDYTVIIRNDSTLSINDVIFNDILSSSLELNPDTVFINSIAEYRTDLINVNLGTINPGSSAIIQFKAIVTTIPCDGYIRNKGTIDFKYIIISEEVEFTSLGKACSNDSIVKVINSKGCCCC